MIPLLPALELAVKVAPIVAQGVCDVLTVIHEHVKGTGAQASSVGLPFKDVANQRRQEREALQKSRIAELQRIANGGPKPTPGRT